MSEIETKKCSKCGEVKPTTEFYKNIKAADGVRYLLQGMQKIIRP